MIFIVCLFVLLKPIVPVLQYIVNYEYIRTELCENKEIPIMGCNGKCYLMKELAKASESEKPLSSDKKHTVIELTDLFFGEVHDFRLSAFQDFQNSIPNAFYSNNYKQQLLFSVFHPPAALS